MYPLCIAPLADDRLGYLYKTVSVWLDHSRYSYNPHYACYFILPITQEELSLWPVGCTEPVRKTNTIDLLRSISHSCPGPWHHPVLMSCTAQVHVCLCFLPSPAELRQCQQNEPGAFTSPQPPKEPGAQSCRKAGSSSITSLRWKRWTACCAVCCETGGNFRTTDDSITLLEQENEDSPANTTILLMMLICSNNLRELEVAE